METGKVYDGVCYQIIPDREGPYYLGETVGFEVRVKNLLGESLERKFRYNIHLPEGMAPARDNISIKLEPHEEKAIRLGDPIFLGFLGIFRVVLITGDPTARTDEYFFAGYSRDREGHELQKSIEKQTRKLIWLTAALIMLTFMLALLTAIPIIPTILQWIRSLGWGA